MESQIMTKMLLASSILVLLAIVPVLATAAGASTRSAVEPCAVGAPAVGTQVPTVTQARDGEASPAAGMVADSWRGAAAAVLCGFYIKVSIGTGGSIGAVVAAVAACTYMVFDALTT